MSNIVSNLSALASDIYSALTITNSRALLAQSGASDAYSAAVVGASRILLVQSRLSDFDSRLVSDVSDIRSLLSDFLSDFQSRVPKAVATNSQLSDLHSDLRSYLGGMSGMLSDTYSLLSDTQSDVLSLLTTTGVQLNASSLSDLRSAIAGVTATVSVSDISDIASAVWANTIGARVDSRLLLNQSRISDTLSMLTVMSGIQSDIYSALSDLRSYVLVGQSDVLSNIYSAALQANSRVLVTQSGASDAASAAVQANSRILLVQSRLSDLDSRLVSDISDIRSAIATTPSAVWATALATKLVQLNTSDLSDLRSAIAGVTATVSVSDISDIASAVWAHTVGTRVDSRLLVGQSFLSDILSGVVALSDATSNAYSAAVVGASRVLLVQSRLSDLDSRLVSDVSDLRSAIATTPSAVWATALATKLVQLNTSDLSDLRSAIAGVTATLSVSDISDIASAVWANTVGVRVDSRLLLNQSRISDIASYLVIMSGVQSDVYSLLSDFLSDFQSRVPKRVATDSQLSDVSSDLRSLLGAGTALTLSAMSDIASQVWAHAVGTRVDSRLLLVQSQTSDVYSNLLALSDAVSDLNSDLRSLLTTTGVQLNASSLSDLRSAIAGVTATLSVSDISDIASAVWANTIGARVDSRLLLNQSRISDIASFLVVMSGILSDVYSGVSDLNSDLRSLVTTTGVQLNASSLSDLRSAIAAGPAATITASDISDIASAVKAILASDVSDILSSTRSVRSLVDSRLPDVTTTGSDLISAIWAYPLASRVVQLNTSDLSDLRSAIAAGPTATITASDISDIASAVWATALATKLVQLNPSDLSDLRSAITAVTAVVSASDMSDIASRVWATAIGTRVDSRLLLVQSQVSDVYSQVLGLSDAVSDLNSDLRSLLTTTGIQLNASSLSDIRSAITAAAVTLDTSTMSDIASQVWAHATGARVDSRLRLMQSQVSDIYSLLSDVSSDLGVFSDVYSDTFALLSSFESDFQSRFPATIPELTGDPGATPTQAQATALQYMWLKNNAKSNSTRRMLRNDAGVTVLSALHAETQNVSYVQGRLG